MTKPVDLGFVKAVPVPHRRQCWLLAGKTKTGKSRFALTFPAPIALLSFDRSVLDVLAEPEMKHVDVRVKDFTRMFNVGEPIEQKQAQEVEAEFARAYLGVLQLPDFRTVIVDKSTTLWEVMRYAEWGKIDHVKPHHYVSVNSRMRRYMMAFQDCKQNVVFVDDVKELWEEAPNGAVKPTGLWRREGFKHSESLVQVCASFERAGKDFSMTLEECALNSSLIGWKFENGQMPFDEGEKVTFPKIADMVVPDSRPEDWR